jgi:hypothetical protein
MWPYYYGGVLPEDLTPAELARARRDLEAVLHEYPTLTPRGFYPTPPSREFNPTMKSALDKPVFPCVLRGLGEAHLKAFMRTREWIGNNANPDAWGSSQRLLGDNHHGAGRSDQQWDRHRSGGGRGEAGGSSLDRARRAHVWAGRL